MVQILEDFVGGFPGGFSVSPHKNEEQKSGDKIHEKIRRPRNRSPKKKERSAKKTDPNECGPIADTWSTH